MNLELVMQIKYPWYNLFCTRDYTPEAVSIPSSLFPRFSNIPRLMILSYW